jgi:hypothetical protein
LIEEEVAGGENVEASVDVGAFVGVVRYVRSVLYLRSSAWVHPKDEAFYAEEASVGLVEYPASSLRMPTFNYMSSPQGRINFTADGNALAGCADSGSDLDANHTSANKSRAKFPNVLPNSHNMHPLILVSFGSMTHLTAPSFYQDLSRATKTSFCRAVNHCK